MADTFLLLARLGNLLLSAVESLECSEAVGCFGNFDGLECFSVEVEVAFGQCTVNSAYKARYSYSYNVHLDHKHLLLTLIVDNSPDLPVSAP